MLVSTQPDFVTSTLEDGDILVIASDGLWDVKSNEDIRKFILTSPDNDTPQQLAEKILQSVKDHYGEEYGTADNTTIVVTRYTKTVQLSLSISDILPDELTPTTSWKTESLSSGNNTPSSDTMRLSGGIARNDTPVIEYSEDS